MEERPEDLDSCVANEAHSESRLACSDAAEIFSEGDVFAPE